MLSGEGMQRRKKVKNNNIGLISNSNFARAAQYFCTFLCLCFARLQLETSRNFLVTRFFCSLFFSLSLIFTLHWWPLAFLILSPPLQNFHVVLPTKKSLLFFYPSLQISVALFLVELRWPAAYFLFFSVFLLLCIPNLWT